MAFLKPTTLDTAGYTYDPMSANSVFGNPSPFMNHTTAASQMPRSHDDSAMPQFNGPRFQRDVAQGSSKPNYDDHRSRREKTQTYASLQLAAFAAALGLALWL